MTLMEQGKLDLTYSSRRQRIFDGVQYTLITLHSIKGHIECDLSQHNIMLTCKLGSKLMQEKRF